MVATDITRAKSQQVGNARYRRNKKSKIIGNLKEEACKPKKDNLNLLKENSSMTVSIEEMA